MFSLFRAGKSCHFKRKPNTRYQPSFFFCPAKSCHFISVHPPHISIFLICHHKKNFAHSKKKPPVGKSGGWRKKRNSYKKSGDEIEVSPFRFFSGFFLAHPSACLPAFWVVFIFMVTWQSLVRSIAMRWHWLPGEICNSVLGIFTYWQIQVFAIAGYF